MNQVYMRFPGGKTKCLTMSYDDGNHADRRLTDLFNRHGIRGTFNLNSGRFGGDNIEAREVKALYRGHEVASHTVNHPNLAHCPGPAAAWEVMEDRRGLEALAGRPVRGFAYPYGAYSDEVIAALRACGIRFARTVESTGSFFMPADFLRWHPTCHHDDPRLPALGKQFLSREGDAHLSLMYVWGHSYEFDRNDNWQVMEDFCAMMGGQEDIWYAANIEIVDAVEAFQRLRFSADNSFVFNPSAQAVWICVNGRPVEIPGGQQINLQE